MPESSSPFIETCPLTSENLGIPDDPDIPAGNKHYFSEEGLIKTPPCLDDKIQHRVTSRPINLQIVPNSDTEIAVEKEMVSGFSCLKGAELTSNTIIHVPVPPINHILSVESVHDEHPSKNLDLNSARGFPDPAQQLVENFILKSMAVEQLWFINL